MQIDLRNDVCDRLAQSVKCGEKVLARKAAISAAFSHSAKHLIAVGNSLNESTLVVA